MSVKENKEPATFFNAPIVDYCVDDPKSIMLSSRKSIIALQNKLIANDRLQGYGFPSSHKNNASCSEVKQKVCRL